MKGWKKALLALCIAIAAAGPAWSADFFSKADSGPWSAPVMTGMVMDLAGFGLLLTGGLLTSVDEDLLDAGLILYHTGSCVMVTGGAVWTFGMGSRESAYVKAKTSGAMPYGGRSWTMTGISAALIIGGFLVDAAIDDWDGDIISVSMGGAGAILELLNAYLVRLPWRDALDAAWLEKGKASGLSVQPSLAIIPAREGRGTGLALAFRSR